jgi:hypothetical protein
VRESADGFKEGQAVWVEEGDGKQHPGVFLGEAERASWRGGAPPVSWTRRLTRKRWCRSLASREEASSRERVAPFEMPVPTQRQEQRS